MVTAVVGANWGDEGKGKITDMLAEKADIVIRFQGGANAGHTIINDYGRFALHTLPSGVFYDHTTSIIGNGVALDIPKLFKEIKSIEDGGVPTPKILVSDRAQMVMPYHVLLDSYEEERLAGASFGSTKSGIAPFYSDKYAKIGFQVSELFEDEKTLKEKIERVIAQKNVLLEHLYHKPLLTVDEVYATLMEYKQMVEPYVADVSAFLYQAMKDGKNVLLEGQLGSMKDPDHGIYPMVTSSSTLAGYGAIGAGIPPYEIKKVVTVCKAYSSAVGAGEFVSEIFDEEADLLLTERDNKAEFLIVRDQAGERLRIKSEEVIFIESFGSEMLVHTAGKCCKSYERLYKLEQILGNDFLRVSNSALINKKFIKDIRPGFSRKFVLTMTDGTLVDVTRSYYDSFRRALNI